MEYTTEFRNQDPDFNKAIPTYDQETRLMINNDSQTNMTQGSFKEGH